ncbi:hypothetical protein ST47_g9930 [Ascochyta rabiei]|uniref:Uncharacterized protein n=1 Tax=Didymella rabiei TaxID=5454 RepID=A0A162WBP9_DIDRA|nr:hypothetical protein ST47_g9930 [Ascochyta rabiei]
MSAPIEPSVASNLTPEHIAFTNAPALLAKAGLVFGFAAAVVVSRIYVRVCILRSFGKDDWAMVLAMLLAAGTFVCYVLEVPLGVGKYLTAVQMDKSNYRELLKMFQCVPVAAAWDTRLRPPPIGKGSAKYFSMQTFGQIGMFNSIINILTDFLLALLPVPLTWQLRLNLRTKISLIFVLSLGRFACIAGIMKIRLKKTILSDPNRFIYDGYSMWNFVELDVSIVAGSFPAIKPPFNKFLNAARGLTRGCSKSSGLGDQNMLRYQKHANQSDREIALVEYENGRPSVRASLHTPASSEKAI